MEENRITLIEAPEGAKFMNEFMNTLPTGILNKKKTGCGATSVALENEENTIVCCPTIQLIKSKTSQYPNSRCRFELFGIYENVSADEINDYITNCTSNHQPVKIMVTYNSFDKVKYAISNNITRYKIIVDEYQELLDAYIYRDKAILNLLQELKSLSNVTYLSATPIPYNFRPEELQNLNEYEIVWNENLTIVPLQFETDTPYSFVKNLINRFKLGQPIKIGENEVREYYFFINSVRGIKEILEETGLTNKEVKIICANNRQNRKYLGGIPISNISDSNKPFTFCTKTVFCGADFYSEYGLAIIVSDGYNKNTMLDIETDIYQIAGRIRNENNPFKNIILHIFNTGTGCQNETEFTAWLEDRTHSAQGIIDAYNTVTQDEQKKAIIERIRIEGKDELALYNEITNEVKLNILKINYFQYKFRSIDSVYKNSASIEDAYLTQLAGINLYLLCDQ